MQQATEFDRETFEPALDALLGKQSTSRRLTWMANLPDPMLHHEHAKLACMLPDWDARRGRVFVRYHGQDMHLELATGKSALLSGHFECELVVDGQSLVPGSDWELTCEYSDEDVHYLEFEQAYELGFSVQRQIALLREDRCCMFADAVIQQDYLGEPDNANRQIEYFARLPVCDDVRCEPDDDVNEVFLHHDSPQALLLPLQADEWRTSRSAQKLTVTNQGNLLLSDSASGQLYSPLWIDLAKKRFQSRRTWRQLAVGENLNTLPRSAAASFRIQCGTSQWILYRSLHEGGPRSFFGKQMITDFFAARFQAHDQSWEQLIVVEGNEEST
ncbi:hypothetical protein CGZ80_01275 [Rhodopirellula sp. MGV]|nr:hypothetical protein CGZ80_01275 [Rhodopirellula sp. MGV]